MVTLKPKLRHRVLHNSLKNLPRMTKTFVKMAFSHGNFQAPPSFYIVMKKGKYSARLRVVNAFLQKPYTVKVKVLLSRTLMNATSNTVYHLTEVESSTMYPPLFTLNVKLKLLFRNTGCNLVNGSHFKVISEVDGFPSKKEPKINGSMAASRRP